MGTFVKFDIISPRSLFSRYWQCFVPYTMPVYAIFNLLFGISRNRRCVSKIQNSLYEWRKGVVTHNPGNRSVRGQPAITTLITMLISEQHQNVLSVNASLLTLPGYSFLLFELPGKHINQPFSSRRRQPIRL